MVNRTYSKLNIWLIILMIRIFVYINNKSKTDDQYLFCATIQLTEPYPPLPITCIKLCMCKILPCMLNNIEDINIPYKILFNILISVSIFYYMDHESLWICPIKIYGLGLI